MSAVNKPLAGTGSDGATTEKTAPRVQGNALLRYAARFDDATVLRWAFFGLLAGTVSVLAMDFMELNRRNAASPGIEPSTIAMPVLPPAVDGDEGDRGEDPRRFLKTDDATLRRAMQFTLDPGGSLRAEGSIEPGTAARFAAELEARGEYVKTVSLNSPGGALADAMAMGRLVRDRGLQTTVSDGALCASSCPLLLAGGKERLVGRTAAVGLHQFYAASSGGAVPTAPGQALSEAQTTTATISRYLGEMGIDAALWLHALDTPPRALYYLSQQELSRYRLATGTAMPPVEASTGSAGSS